MARKLKLKKRRAQRKERPFYDEDTQIQIREDFVRVYCLEPLMRKAQDDPVIDRVLTPDIIKDIETLDEDDDIGVRTRERYLPQMPVHSDFFVGMKHAMDPLWTRRIEMCLRFYNDAIRWDRELAKVFLIGMIRQLRYWVLSQHEQPHLGKKESALEWVRDELLPRISADMGVVEDYNCPEIDLEYFRRWEMEIDSLRREINERLGRTERAREKGELGELSPEEMLTDPDISLEEFLEWSQLNPTQAIQSIASVRKDDTLTFHLWSKLFSSPGATEFLELFDHMESADISNRDRKALRKQLLSVMSQTNTDGVQKLLEHPAFSNMQAGIIQTLQTTENTAHRQLLNNLQLRYQVQGTSLIEAVLTDPGVFLDLITPTAKE